MENSFIYGDLPWSHDITRFGGFRYQGRESLLSFCRKQGNNNGSQGVIIV